MCLRRKIGWCPKRHAMPVRIFHTEVADAVLLIGGFGGRLDAALQHSFVDVPPSAGWPMDSPHGQVTLLYDLKNDPGETTNLAQEHPDVVKRLETEHAAWAQQLKQDPILPAVRSTLAEFHGERVQLIF